jgi:molybdenum cofactor cytidylyltransferase
MGRDKALLPYRGRTFLETIIAKLREAGVERVAVVLGHHAEEIKRAAKLDDVEVAINRDYASGQTSSLQAGLRTLESPDLEAIVLCLVDHPAVSAPVIRELIAAFQKSRAPVVIPTFSSQRGHPVLIGRELFPQLTSLDSNEGANTVIRRYCKATQFIEVEDPGILLDIDDPEAYRRLM